MTYALGTAIEVAAQRLQETRGPRAAVEFLDAELAKTPGPVSLRSRIHKRLNLVRLEGKPAPEIVVEDHLGDAPPSIASLRGHPVLVFVWAEGCGDCRAQAATLAKVRSRWGAKDLRMIALTRYYEHDAADRVREKAHADSVWNADYRDVGPAPIVFSTPSMEVYGGSSTPTFVFVDRKGIVRRYTPTRLDEEEFDRTLAELVR